MTRRASCCCGACAIEVTGEPTLNAICYCDNCRRRTGSAFGWSAYFSDADVVARTGEFAEYRIRDEQVRAFCPRCGTTLFWKAASLPGQTGVAGGAFVETPLPEPALVATTDKAVSWIGLPDHWWRAP